MKRVLILSSSPRKGGNSDLLCDALAEGAREAGHEVTKIRLADRRIGYCVGCYACKALKHCVQQDDAAAVLEAMLAADVIVLASPVYFYSVSAQLKALFDRSVAIYPNLTNKAYVFLATMADTEERMLSGTFTAMQGFLDCYDGSTLVAKLGVPGVYAPGEVRTTGALEKARAIGRAL